MHDGDMAGGLRGDGQGRGRWKLRMRCTCRMLLLALGFWRRSLSLLRHSAIGVLLLMEGLLLARDIELAGCTAAGRMGELWDLGRCRSRR